MTKADSKKQVANEDLFNKTEIVDIIKNHTENMEEKVRDYIDSTTRFIRKNPMTSALAAFAVGYLIARVTTRARIVYEEKTK